MNTRNSMRCHHGLVGAAAVSAESPSAHCLLAAKHLLYKSKQPRNYMKLERFRRKTVRKKSTLVVAGASNKKEKKNKYTPKRTFSCCLSSARNLKSGLRRRPAVNESLSQLSASMGKLDVGFGTPGPLPPAERAVSPTLGTLLESFDIEPFPDFSAK